MTEREYFVQEFKEDEVSEMRKGVFYDENGNPRWKPHHSWQWTDEDIEQAMGADQVRIAGLEAERDSLREQNAALREALIAIRDEREWEWCNIQQLSVPAEFQTDRMAEFVAREALRLLEGKGKTEH